MIPKRKRRVFIGKRERIVPTSGTGKLYKLLIQFLDDLVLSGSGISGILPKVYHRHRSTQI